MQIFNDSTLNTTSDVSELIDVNVTQNIAFNAATALLPRVPKWVDFFNTFNDWYKLNYEVNGFTKPWTFNYGSMMQKIYLDSQYLTALNDYNKANKTNYIPAPPTWNDVYMLAVTAPGGYYDKFGDVVNRSWNSDNDMRMWKTDLDNQYVAAVTKYNATYGTSFLCDANAFGPYAQENFIHYPEQGGGFFNTGFGKLVIVGSSVIFGPQMAALASQIGVAVVGQAGMLANAVGNIALNTVLNGGNVENAIKGYATGFAGSQIGGNIGSFVGSDNVGRAASAAATAAIRGADVNKAVATSLLNIGSDYVKTLGDTKMDDYNGGSGDGYGPFQPGDGYGPFQPGDGYGPFQPGDGYAPEMSDFSNSDIGASMSVDYANGDGYFTVEADGGTYYVYDDGSVQFLDSGDNLFTLNDDGTTDQYHVGDNSYTPVQSGSIDWGGFVKDATAFLTTAASSALKLVNVWNQFGNKAARSATPITLPNGGRSVPNKNGTITVTTNGRSVTTPMAVGQPYTFPDGTTVINNGNGTVTTINSNGQSYTSAAGASGSGSGSNTGLLVMGGIAAFLLLGR